MPPLTPEQLAEASARLDGLTQKLEKTVLDDICRRIAKAGAVTDSAEWQMLRLKEMGYANDVIEQAVSEYTKRSAAEVQQLFHEAAQVSDVFYSEMYTQSGKPFVPVDENPYMQQLISSVVEQTQNELVNLTRSMGFAVRQPDGSTTFKPAAKAYQSALDLAQMQVATGTFDYTTAIRNSVKALTDGGLQFVDYASGHRNRADVAARRAILTGLSQMTGKVSEHNAEELETDIVEVTAHAGARPDHAEWQGRRYSLSGKSKEYRSLEEATGYGTGDGLKGWNCRHDFYPVIPGISPPAYTEEQLANIDPPPIEYNGKTLTYYECTQKQRAMETAMRKTKREIIAAKASGDDDMFTAKSIRLRRQKEEYAKFSDKAGLLTQNERTQVYGFDKSISAKAAWAVKKAQSASGGSSAPAPSGGKAVTVNAPAPASSGKAYTGEKIMKPLDKPLENKVKAVEMPQAKNIEEAQAYAKKLGVEYPDYSKFTVERANNMNKALSTLPDDSAPYVVTDLQKYTAVTGAPLDKRAKNGYACTVTPYEIDLKRAKIADTSRISGSGDTVVAVNTKTYKTLDSITESKARSEELIVSRNLGKAYHFNTDGKATDFHECGHVYASKHGLPMAFSADVDRWYRETGCELLKSPSEAWAEAYAAYYTHADDLPSYIRRYFDNGEWKTNSGSKVLTLDEWYKKLLDNGGGSGIIEETKKNINKYIGQPITQTDNQHIREWYYANVSDIPNQINPNLPLDEQAKQAFELRNKYKHQARAAMTDTKTAEMLEKKRPAPTFDELVESKMKRKGMTREEAIKDILKTASKTNEDVNKEFGL